MMTATLFPGNCPRNVSKDAKYGVKGSKIGLSYWSGDDELWHMTTIEHPQLAEMVNDIKTSFGNGPNGPFYINEFHHVIVPVGDDAEYHYAGPYDTPLRFKFEGKTISGEPIDLDGKPLELGEKWPGPHAGIPYVLTAAGNDVYYRTFPRPNVEKRVRLSAHRGSAVAEQVARLLAAFKGTGGGRFYVNEFRSVFTPINGDDGLQYVYIGQIDLASWFRDPLASDE